jgi:hypothetical protein
MGTFPVFYHEKHEGHEERGIGLLTYFFFVLFVVRTAGEKCNFFY